MAARWATSGLQLQAGSQRPAALPAAHTQRHRLIHITQCRISSSAEVGGGSQRGHRAIAGRGSSCSGSARS